MLQYSVLARFYDGLNADFDYDGYAAFVSGIFKENGVGPGDLVLDLACGTGSLTTRLSAMGYDMTGVDVSAEMLDIAREKSSGAGLDVLWLCQDMRSFELYGTVRGVVCSLDGVNYLLRRKDIRDCFATVRNYLEPGGIFIFDINTKHRFETEYSDRDYILEDDGVFCGWRNSYSEKTGICDFYLTFFYEENGRIYRSDEHQRERCWSERTIDRALRESGFETVGIFSDTARSPASPDASKLYFVCRCLK